VHERERKREDRIDDQREDLTMGDEGRRVEGGRRVERRGGRTRDERNVRLRLRIRIVGPVAVVLFEDLLLDGEVDAARTVRSIERVRSKVQLATRTAMRKAKRRHSRKSSSGEENVQSSSVIGVNLSVEEDPGSKRSNQGQDHVERKRGGGGRRRTSSQEEGPA